MSDKPSVNVGDWIAFMKDGRVVYGRVEYVRRDSIYRWQVVTTSGVVDGESVLERRPASEPKEPQ
jgi:hypothetical protein